MQIILLYVPIWYVYQHFEANIPIVFSKQTMEVRQTVFIIAVRHVLSLKRILRDLMHTFSFAVQEFKFLRLFASHLSYCPSVQCLIGIVGVSCTDTL